MLHRFQLPPPVYTSLRKVVFLQIDLLRYAMTMQAGAEITERNFAKHLRKHTVDKDFRENAANIAQWYWNWHWQKVRSVDYLQAFVKLQPHERQKKQIWVERIANEICDLLNVQLEKILLGTFLEGENVPRSHEVSTLCSWKGAAYYFFLPFYEAFLGSKTCFPGFLFADRRPFGRKEFFQAMVEHNRGVTICPICDENRYYTRVDKHIYGTIDHYFPKALYPHFACHPCNLLPTCASCNTTFKGSQDPLEHHGQRQPYLARTALPYTTHASDTIYLQVTLGDASHHMIHIGPIISYPPSEGLPGEEIQCTIDMLKKLYRIPERWDALKIGEMVFRRMRQFLDNGHITMVSNNSVYEIYTRLEQLLYYLDQEDRQKDPYAFALTWTLVACIRDQILPYLSSTEKSETTPMSPLLEEIEQWFGSQFINVVSQRSQRARELLSMPDTTSLHADTSKFDEIDR